MQWSDFLGKTFVFVVLIGFWEGKLLQSCQKKAYVDRKTIEKSGILLRLIWFLKLLCQNEQFFSDFGWKFWNKDVNTAFSASRWTSSAKISFIGINYHFQFILDFKEENFGYSAKKNQDVQNCIQHVRSSRCMKKCFFWISYNFCTFVRTARNTFQSSAKNSLVGSPNCMYVSKWKVRTKWLFFEPFKFNLFPDFERKISSSVMKT